MIQKCGDAVYLERCHAFSDRIERNENVESYMCQERENECAIGTGKRKKFCKRKITNPSWLFRIKLKLRAEKVKVSVKTLQKKKEFRRHCKKKQRAN